MSHYCPPNIPFLPSDVPLLPSLAPFLPSDVPLRRVHRMVSLAVSPLCSRRLPSFASTTSPRRTMPLYHHQGHTNCYHSGLFIGMIIFHLWKWTSGQTNVVQIAAQTHLDFPNGWILSSRSWHRPPAAGWHNLYLVPSPQNLIQKPMANFCRKVMFKTRSESSKSWWKNKRLKQIT